MSRTILSRTLAALALLLLAGCLGLAGLVSTPARPQLLAEPSLPATASLEPSSAPAPASIDQLQAQIAAVLEREGVPGAGIALVDRNGLIWSGGVGVADRASGRPVTADSQFRVASITKSVVALGVMRLVEQGRLRLDQPLRALMPDIEFENRWAETAPITLAHALEHTTGFDDMRFNEWFIPGGEEGISPRAALGINPRSRVARWQPGSRMSYANPGYTLAGHAIELTTGEPWEQVLEREVLGPLGMPSARFRRTPAFADRLVTGYHQDQPAAFRPIAHAPAGALLASPRELAQLVLFWLRRGQLDGPGSRPIVGPESLARIEGTETVPHAVTDGNYGLGNYGDVMHPVRGRGHDGGLPGFLSSYRYFPELGVGYVMLLNATHSPRAYVEIRTLLFAYLTRDMSLPPAPTAPPDPEAIAAAAGYYGYANPRIELFGFLDRALIGLRVRPAPGGIGVELLTGGSVELIPTGDGGFRHPSEGGTSLRLTEDGHGHRVVVTGMGYFEPGSWILAKARLWGLAIALGLMQLAPLWGLSWLLFAGVARLRGRPVSAEAAALHLWPGLAALSYLATTLLLQQVFAREAFIDANLWSVGLCLASLAFAAASAMAFAQVVRAARRGGIPRLLRLVPSACGLACFVMALYLADHGIIGLAIWRW